MNTLFELTVKAVGIKADTEALYLYQNDKLILKVGYHQIEAVFGLVVNKIKQLQDDPQFKKIVESKDGD